MKERIKSWWWVILGLVIVTVALAGLVWLTLSGPVGAIAGLLIIWVIGTSLTYAVRVVGMRVIVIWFAEKDVWWSPVRMIPGAGHISMMVKGLEEGGAFDRVLPGKIPYWHFHKEDRRFYYEGSTPEENALFSEKFPYGPPEVTDWLDKLLEEYGAVWVGFGRRYYRRRRHWKSYDAEEGVVHKEMGKGEDHIFYFATTVAVDLETVPTKDNYPAQMKVVMNLLLIHPERAEFLAGKPEAQGIAAGRTRAREYIASKTVAELRDERDGNKKDDFVDTILFANEGDPASKEAKTIKLLPEYGVMIQGPYYVDFDLESGDADMTAAMRRQMIAREDVETAKVRAEEAKIRGQGEARERKARAKGIEKEVAAWASKPGGTDVAYAEAIKTQQNLKFLNLSLGREGRGGVMVGVNSEDSE